MYTWYFSHLRSVLTQPCHEKHFEDLSPSHRNWTWLYLTLKIRSASWFEDPSHSITLQSNCAPFHNDFHKISSLKIKITTITKHGRIEIIHQMKDLMSRSAFCRLYRLAPVLCDAHALLICDAHVRPNCREQRCKGDAIQRLPSPCLAEIIPQFKPVWHKWSQFSVAKIIPQSKLVWQKLSPKCNQQANDMN